VKVTVSQDTASSFAVEISDTGVGMTEERLHFIRDNLNRQQDITGGGAHIGVINVHQRNQYIFGEEYGLHVRSEKSLGTKFILRLPLTEQNGGKANVYNPSS
jgi:two-component system sensor histidine kinase YesM